MYNFLYVSGHLRYHDTRYRSVLTVLSYTPPVATERQKELLTSVTKQCRKRYVIEEIKEDDAPVWDAGVVLFALTGADPDFPNDFEKDGRAPVRNLGY